VNKNDISTTADSSKNQGRSVNPFLFVVFFSLPFCCAFVGVGVGVLLRAFFSIDVVFDVWVPTLACSHRVQQLILGDADWTGRIWAALLTGPGTVFIQCERLVCI
jgi:hypothetical protein